MTITLVLPTYNEVENLPKMVSALYTLPLADLHLIIVDDNSPDGTGELAETLAAGHPGKMTVIHRPGKMGLGTAYVTGFKTALAQGAELVGQMDTDFSHPVEKVPELVKALDACEVAIGSRYIRGGSVDERWPAWRKALSSFANFYARSILRLPMKDVTAGFRMYRREALQRIPLDRIRSNGYSFQVETAYLTHRLGLTCCEVPIYFADRRWGVSKMSLKIQLESAFRVWQLLWIYRGMR